MRRSVSHHTLRDSASGLVHHRMLSAHFDDRNDGNVPFHLCEQKLNIRPGSDRSDRVDSCQVSNRFPENQSSVPPSTDLTTSLDVRGRGASELTPFVRVRECRESRQCPGTGIIPRRNTGAAHSSGLGQIVLAGSCTGPTISKGSGRCPILPLIDESRSKSWGVASPRSRTTAHVNPASTTSLGGESDGSGRLVDSDIGSPSSAVGSTHTWKVCGKTLTIGALHRYR